MTLIDQGEDSLQYNPLAGGAHDDLARLQEARRALDHAAVQTRGMARTLQDVDMAALVRVDPGAHQPVTAALGALGAVLVHLAGSLSAYGRLQESPESVSDRAHAVAEHAAAAKARHAASGLLRQVSVLDDDKDRLLSSLLVDVQRLMHEIDPVNGAHTAAVAR